MNRITLRYKKAEWNEWVYLTGTKEEIEVWARELRVDGYIVQY